MKKIVLTLLSLSFLTQAFAQDSRKAADAIQEKVTATGELKEGWTKNGVLSITLNHTSNDNWVGASEKYALSINGNLNYSAYRKWGKNLWKNDLLVAYGVLRSPSTYDKFRKNDDRLNLLSTYAHQINKKFYYAAALEAATQMTPGYDYKSPTAFDTSGAGVVTPSKFAKVSNFLTPGNIRLGIGILYQPRANFSVYYSPVTLNLYTKIDKDFVNIDMNSVEPGKKVRAGVGSLLRADYFTTINKNFTYKTRFTAFTDYLNRPFQKIDLDWLNTFMFNATKYIGVKLDVNFRYYEGQAKNKIQYLEMLGVGFAYKF